MFEAIAAVLLADEHEESRRAAVRAGVERARAVREADRLLASIPLEEPSGVCAGLRGAVQRLQVAAEVRGQLDGIVAERDAVLVSSLRRVLRAYQSFAVAAADAFDEVFGGVLPPIGAVFSEQEAEKVRLRMRELCERVHALLELCHLVQHESEACDRDAEVHHARRCGNLTEMQRRRDHRIDEITDVAQMRGDAPGPRVPRRHTEDATDTSQFAELQASQKLGTQFGEDRIDEVAHALASNRLIGRCIDAPECRLRPAMCPDSTDRPCA
jgi:hypothetical protein